jgi:protein ImuB
MDQKEIQGSEPTEPHDTGTGKKDRVMKKRYVTIWFRYLKTDWVTIRNKALGEKPLVLTAMDHGRKMITAVNPLAEKAGLHPGMVLADARTLIRNMEVMEEETAIAEKVLNRLAQWCIRFTPVVMPDLPDGLILDATGCPHLWGGEEKYIKDLLSRLQGFGFHARAAVADTIGVAWAITRYTRAQLIVPPGETMAALLPLPPAALRLDPYTVEQLEKLGLRQIKSFIGMPRTSLQRRFGEDCIRRIGYALGHEEEIRVCVHPPEPWQERLPCLEPILTRTGIEIALQQLLETLCSRLRKEGKGLRAAIFKGYRADGKTVSLNIGTGHPSHNEEHLHTLFALKFENFEPGPGIELFTLDAQKVEEALPAQAQLWGGSSGAQVAELIDRLSTRFGDGHVHRYQPDEHYWPERSVRDTQPGEKTTTWPSTRPRPLQLLPQPESIEVMAPVPDYPPMHFRHKGKLHRIAKADGPERIEQEWWLSEGEHRDYYYVEDEEGQRYWLFRSGHYNADKTHGWYLHGYFA